MLQAELVIHTPDRPGRAPEVAEFFLAVQRGRIYDDVVMDMVFIHMGANNKSMVSLRQLQCQFPPDLVRFFRRDLAGLERLPEMVGNHIIRARSRPVRFAYCRLDKRNSASAVRCRTRNHK